MKRVGVFEAKARFSALVADAQAGKRTVVTKNGKPVAEVGPVKTAGNDRAEAAAKRILALHDRLAAAGKLEGINIRDLIYEGRK